MLAIFTVPSASTIIDYFTSTTPGSGSGAYGVANAGFVQGFFNAYSSLIFAIAVGVPVAVLGVLWLIRALNKSSRQVLGKRR